MKEVVYCAAVVAFYAFFYRSVVKRWGAVVQPLIDRLGMQESHSTREVEAVAKLTAATVAQLGFAVVLIAVTGVGTRDLVGDWTRVDVLVLAAVLGIGELALSGLLCAAIVVGSGADADPARGGAAAWLAQGRGGWMSQFRATVRIAPRWLAAATVILYVSVEEIVFRGVTLTVLRGVDSEVAIAVSVALFMLVQVFNMPSLRGAIFPMGGALVVGVTHSIIYTQAPGVLPLAVAHSTFFLGALAMFSPPAPAGRMH
ncbi:type II CAAX prenyl endopeptidase Rce1 family protein [Pyxidicoccus caerfyrddinensis]|uniref:CPBP family glutamic-type intramembrane protease n=1 Tax=Pyxidicoccus caerfyrddinensis TaxID=2709663 RepID=UPI0013D97744|nr:CPBP family glutamic-type intramembrane protease [Pyxidicoccus caerfyrddinensis]